jgi:PadR family transcriptional regulator PadR
MGADGLLGAFEEQVLLAVIRTAGDAYGMEVRREIERTSERDVAIGAVYATLDRLEAKGLVTSARPRGEQSRRTFMITRDGLSSLAATRAVRERLWRGVNLGRLRPETH